MEFATGALGTILRKLAQLLQGEYKLQKAVRKNIKFLRKELEHTEAALRTVGEVPLEQLPELVKTWARDARELSYDMEDVVDTFLVHVEGPDPPSRKSTRKFIQKMKSLLHVGKRHQIGEQIKDIKERVKDLAERRDRYKVDTINPVVTLDPRIGNLYAKATNLVGIEKSREELVLKLTMADDMSIKQQRIISIVGFGGLGKTTLAKAVYDEMKTQFDCRAFVTISRNPDMKKFLKDMLYEFDKMVYGDIHNKSLDEKQLIDIIRRFLHDKRYLVIIDDIWDITHWDRIIKHALPDDNTGCRIISTTRNFNVAKHMGHAYKMQPLSLDTSRTLLYRRIFGTEDSEKCILDKELAEVSNKILKKCAGVPLAIITIASLLAGKGRNKVVWDEVCNSIGNGMENSLDAKSMRKILSYSYYDLPSYLRACLLYLSIFPEDFEIEKDRLIWLWVAEGFIQPDKQCKKSLFEIGETYFNELINRSMIHPLHFNYMIRRCRVHDMVLDLICSISSEENFITILSNTDPTSASTIVRRLSLQQGKTTCAMNQATQSMQLVRSVVVFPSPHGQMPTFRSFKVLRVLDLQDCDLSEHGYYLQHLGCLFHLRYLNLNRTRIDQLPESVGNLRHLEILDVWKNNIAQLPKCVARLTHLLCLVIDPETRISNWIGSLTFLEELSYLCIDDESADNIHSLGLLTELRVLHINLRTDKCIDNLVESLCKLPKIQELVIDVDFDDHQRFMGILDAWIAPQQLRELYAWTAFFFLTLPAWSKNVMQYQDLTHLFIGVRELQHEDLEILGRLPALYILHLIVGHKDFGILRRRLFTVGAGWFPCLVTCRLRGFLWPVRFQQGAMPGVRELTFDFHVPEATEIAGKYDGFELGLENLLSLGELSVRLDRGGASEAQVEEVEAALRRTAESHPNNKLRLWIG